MHPNAKPEGHPQPDQTFGDWTIIREAARRGYARYYQCQCRCGRRADISMGSLKSGASRGCGCRRDQLTKVRNSTHGLSHTREHETWAGMKARCYRPSCKSYRDYGARGITVCEAWQNSFEQFYADMGPRPFEGATIERIDNSGPYAPENCRWATKAEQSRNTTRSLIIEHDGQRMTASEWSRKLGGNDLMVSCRIRRGWTHHDAVTIPPMDITEHWRGHGSSS